MRFIGLDVHRDFCEVAISDGGKARRAGRVAARPAELELFAQSLAADDRVVLEATGNALAIARVVEPHVGEVVLAHSRKLRAIAEAKVKTDAVDACTLAELLAADLVPRVWVGDERTRLLRRLVSRRRQLVKQATRTKNEIHAVLLRNLKGRPPMSDVFGKAGRVWLAGLELGLDERETVEAGLRQLDFFAVELAHVDRAIAAQALASAEIRRLMTIPGLDVTTAAALMAAIGDIERFASPRQLVGYLGLDPKAAPVRSGEAAPRPDFERGLGRCSARAHRGGVVGGEGAGAAARLRRAHGRPPRPPHRRRRSRAQAGGARLAPIEPRRGLRLPTPVGRAAQAAPAGAENGRAARESVRPGHHRSGAAGGSTSSSASSHGRQSSPTSGSSTTGSGRGHETVRVRHRGAHLLGRQSGKQRGRSQPHPLRFSSSSPAPTQTLPPEPPIVHQT